MSVTDGSDGDITVTGRHISVIDCSGGGITVTEVPYDCY
jgi:hypothetical protein